MRDLERELLELKERLSGSIEPSPVMADRVFRRARARRATTAVVGMLAAGALGLASIAGVRAFMVPISGGPAATQPNVGSSTPTPRPGWVVYRDESDDVSIQAPATWNFNPEPVPNLVSPNAVFALGSGSVPSGGNCAPTAAVAALPPDGMLLWIDEYPDPEHARKELAPNPYGFPPRPARFDLGPLRGPFGCAAGEKTHLVLFREAGRFFQAHIMFGPQAGEKLRSDVVDSLSTFDPSPSGTSFAEKCRQGPWIYCARAVWVFEAVNRARFFHWGNTGSAIEFERGDHRVYVWTTSEDEGPSREEGYRATQEIDGVTVYSDGERLAWEAQGAYVWVERARRGSSLPEGNALEDLVRATLEVRFVDDAE